MKCLVQEIEGEGLHSFLGKQITVWCGVYIYTGKLVGVNDTCIKLTEAKVVYETGPLDNSSWSDAQALPGNWYVQIAAIESFGYLK